MIPTEACGGFTRIARTDRAALLRDRPPSRDCVLRGCFLNTPPSRQFQPTVSVDLTTATASRPDARTGQTYHR